MFESFSIAHADKDVRSRQRRSIVILLAISFLPLILGFISQLFENEFSDSFRLVFLSGDLYFYAISLCASMYILSQESNDEGNLGMRLWTGAFAMFCVAFTALYIGQGQGDIGQLSHGIFSVIFLLIAANLSYRIAVRAESPPLPESVNREQAEELTAGVNPDYGD